MREQRREMEIWESKGEKWRDERAKERNGEMREQRRERRRNNGGGRKGG